MKPRAKKRPAVSGVCRFCKCTESTPCHLLTIAISACDVENATLHSSACGGAVGTQVCSNPACLEKYRMVRR